MMGFTVIFTVKRGGVRQKDVEISYLYNGSKHNLTSDSTNHDGEAKTTWDDIWKGRTIDIYFDGRNKREITLHPRDKHTINLPGACFPYRTHIQTPTGERYIGEIKDGDVVLCFDAKKSLLTPRKVIKNVCHEPVNVIEVKMKEGKSLFVTESHRILTRRGYVKVNMLKDGDHLLVHADNLSYTIFDKLIEINRTEAVYNLIVAGNFNYIADGFVAHSFTRLPALLACFWTICDRLHLRPQFVSQFLPLQAAIRPYILTQDE